MQRSGDAATPMQQGSEIRFLVGDGEVLERMGEVRPLPIFAPEAVGLLQALSRRLMGEHGAKQFPDLATFAFWCRPSSLRQMAAGYGDAGIRLGRGVVFHIAPSNVAMNFAYSFAAALLAGNASVVRLPSRAFPQVDLFCGVLQELLRDEMPEMRPYVCMVRYGHDKDINDRLSLLCDTRILWGGDRTIGLVRQSPLKPRGTEVTFADRFSVLLIRPEAYLRAPDKKRIARDFYNDTYLTDQNACTSPRILFWWGKQAGEAQQVFWEELRDVLQEKGYALSGVQAVDKLDRLCCLAAEREAGWIPSGDNRLFRVRVRKLDGSLRKHIGNSGFFLEYASEDLQELAAICDERCQTLSFYGVGKEELDAFVRENRPRGIDRIVPLGRTMDFSLTWDGVDLVRALSRNIVIE